ncbi:sigma 54-interacting transcriptional regulator [Planctomicrobium sp. SH664]|uniref:sigma 54-interacting transcriptional regulator n=1 Tax=Planctomicrobium sp. SH664 TaxID=3448125 RepID=UPI003F5B5091
MSQRTRRGLALWLTTSTAPLFVLDDRRVILVFNKGMVDLTQWDAAEVIGQTCTYRAEGDSRQIAALTGALCPPEEVLSGRPVTVPVTIPCRNGESTDRNVHFFLLPPGDGEGKNYVLALVAERVPALSPVPTRHYELGQHLADLFRRYHLSRFVARSPALTRVATQIQLCRQTEVPVHIIGEPGTGKEHLARLIHYHSAASAKRFVPLRCQESSHFELRRTLLRLQEENADNSYVGTVYLDGVELLPRDLQSLVGQLIQQGNRRWMSASARGLEGLGDDRFDPLLRAQLTPMTISLPPLAERGEDLLLLAQQILEEANHGRERQLEGFSPEVERLFQLYRWPGQIDELTSIIDAAARRCQTSQIQVSDLPYEFFLGTEGQTVRPAVPAVPLEQRLESYERREIERTLEECRGNKTLAAERLGMPRPRLYRRMAALGLIEAADSDLDDGIEIESEPKVG